MTSESAFEYGGLKTWSKPERDGPGVETVCAQHRIGSTAFTVGVQAGCVDKISGDWWSPPDSHSFRWNVWNTAGEFLTWQEGGRLARIKNRLNFFEPIGNVSRLVFNVTAPPGHACTKDEFFRSLVAYAIPRVEAALAGIGAPTTLLGGAVCSAWRFVDTSVQSGPHSFRVYSQRVKLTERARCALLREMGSASAETPYILDLQPIVCAGRALVMVKCIDSRDAHITNNPLSEAAVLRMISGDPMVFADFTTHGGFFEDGLLQPLSQQDLEHYSIEPRFVAGSLVVDVACGPRAVPQWATGAMAELNERGFGPVGEEDIVGDAIAYPDGRCIVTLRLDGGKCPAGIAHTGEVPLQLRLEADGCVFAICCGKPRGTPDDLFVLDNKNKRTGEMRPRAASIDACSQLALTPCAKFDTFLDAEELPPISTADPPGIGLPAFTRDVRQAMRERYGKPEARYWVLTHVCGTGKSRQLMIPALVEHVKTMEAKPQFTECDLYAVIAAPTRNLVDNLYENVNDALAIAGCSTRCTHYQDDDLPWSLCGVLVCCTHSLGKIAKQGGKIQLLLNDEVDEGLNSVANLNPDSMRDILDACKMAEEVIWADAMAGQVVMDALKYLHVPKQHVITLDTPVLRPFRGAPTRIIIPAKKNGKVVEDAAVYEAIRQAEAGRIVLFVAPSVFEVRVLEKALKVKGIKCTVAHGKMGGTEDFRDDLCTRTRATTLFKCYAMSPIIPSGVSSRGLFDVVVACLKTCSVSAKVIMQMVERARDPTTEVIMVASEQSLLRAPAGEWSHERVDFPAAAKSVQDHVRSRALVAASSVQAATDVLALADLQRTYGDGKGELCIGLAPAPALTVPVDDEAFYVQTKLGWYRITRTRRNEVVTLEDVMYDMARPERLALAAREVGEGARVGAILGRARWIRGYTEDALERVKAHSRLEEKTRKRDFLRTLAAIIHREERAYTAPQLVLFDDDSLGLKFIRKTRLELRAADFIAYVRYEAEMLRPLDGTGLYKDKLERYKAMEELFLDRGKADARKPKRAKSAPNDDGPECRREDHQVRAGSVCLRCECV